MDILNKIMDLLKENKKQQQDLTNFLGLEKSTFTGWKSGKSQSYLKYLPEIAEFFGISVDALLGNKEISPVAQTDQEAKLLELYRKLKPLEQARILLLANKLANASDEDTPKIAAYGGKEDIFSK